MAIGDPYLSVTQLKDYLSITSSEDDALIHDAIAAISRGIESTCGRQFNDAGTASARVLAAGGPCQTSVPDFHTTVGLVVETDDNDDGTAEITWTTADYELLPLGGVVDGVPGWPYSTIRAVGSRRFPVGGRRTGRLRVTARWGWATVPPGVSQAAKVLAMETYRHKDAPWGVAGVGDFGPIRVRESPAAMKHLRPYILDPVLVTPPRVRTVR